MTPSDRPPRPGAVALLETLLPLGERLPALADREAIDALHQFLRALPFHARHGFSAALATLDAMALAKGAHSFARLPVDQRERLLRELDDLPALATSFSLLLRLMPLLASFSTPRVMDALGVSDGQLVPLDTPLPPVEPLPVLRHPRLRSTFSDIVDVVIIGSGAGGAPVARALARAGWSVAIVEEGDAYTRDDFSGPPLERVVRLYRDAGATMTLGSPPVLTPVGRAVGGTTVVNSGTCFHTPDRVLASWREKFGLQLTPGDLHPYYEEVDMTLGVAPVPWERMGANGHLMARGALALGLRGRPIDRNASGCHGSGVCAAGCPVDGKRGVYLNYLPQAVAAGAVIFAGCRAERVMLQNRRATGVRGHVLRADGTPAGQFTLHARRGVIVAAGAPMTPLLLHRSGVRLPALGHNLHVHPCVTVTGLFPHPVKAWRGVMQSFVVDALAEQGVMLEATFPPPALGLAEAGLELVGGELIAFLEQADTLASIGVLVSDTGGGRVWNRMLGQTPLMTYRFHQHDARRALDGMALAARILFAAGAHTVRPMLRGAGALHDPRDATRCFARDWPVSAFHLSAYHPMGTARMGADARAVTDAHGFVHGVRRLAVADASIFPTSLAVNPQVTIMAFATRTAQAVLDRW